VGLVAVNVVIECAVKDAQEGAPDVVALRYCPVVPFAKLVGAVFPEF
jgi:hypothetical protein